MSYRALIISAFLVLALNLGGCRSSSNKDYDEVLMPRQTGSVFQRRVQVQSSGDKKSKKKKTEKTDNKEKKEKARKADAEPSATPAPEEESTPPPDRFR
jgi:hypothetical protein